MTVQMRDSVIVTAAITGSRSNRLGTGASIGVARPMRLTMRVKTIALVAAAVVLSGLATLLICSGDPRGAKVSIPTGPGIDNSGFVGTWVGDRGPEYEMRTSGNALLVVMLPVKADNGDWSVETKNGACEKGGAIRFETVATYNRGSHPFSALLNKVTLELSGSDVIRQTWTSGGQTITSELWRAGSR